MYLVFLWESPWYCQKYRIFPRPSLSCPGSPERTGLDAQTSTPTCKRVPTSRVTTAYMYVCRFVLWASVGLRVPLCTRTWPTCIFVWFSLNLLVLINFPVICEFDTGKSKHRAAQHAVQRTRDSRTQDSRTRARKLLPAAAAAAALVGCCVVLVLSKIRNDQKYEERGNAGGWAETRGSATYTSSPATRRNSY